MTEYLEKTTWQKIGEIFKKDTAKAHAVGCVCIHCGSITGVTSAGCPHTFTHSSNAINSQIEAPFRMQGGSDV